MLLTREEMSYDFAGAKLDPVKDREILAWMMNQFLYGEITGIQIGHWLYDAPDLESARFLARQAVEEFQHVDNFLRIMTMLDCEPQRVNPVVAFLATGMMGETWAEHVALEMAAGEGFVLMAFYGIIDSLDHEGVTEILKRAVKQEERHVDFGEKQTMKLIAGRPWLRRRLLGLSLVSLWGVKRLARFMAARLPKDHPVLSQLPAFLEKTVACADLRLQRLGLTDRPLARYGTLARAALIGEAYLQKAGGALWRLVTWPIRLLPFVAKKRRLTDTYLDDPAIRALPAARSGAPATDEA
jgi:bacterioferritin (cytochrome b1)